MTFLKDHSAGYLANQLARLFAEGLQERIQALGITTGQFPALLALWEKDGLTQAELVRATDVEQATMAATLKRMERDGLVRRKPHPDDSRAQQVFLTERAKQIRQLAYTAANEQNGAALADFSPGEVEQFLHLMRKAITTMREQNKRSS